MMTDARREDRLVKIEHEAVTGKEQNDRLTAQMRALSGFYRALNTGDISLMSRVWAQTDDVSMDNPVGGITRGWKEIRQVYERIFASVGRYWFEFYDYTFHDTGDLFYVVGRERGEYKAGESVLAMRIRTTRVFRKIDGEWRQVHHHGSIEDPELLRTYQDAIRASRSDGS
jgi:ketosteroid isomerase-like protein